jgi:hypothetical protein
MRQPVEQRKRPGSLRSPGLCEQSVEGARLGASFSRMQRTLGPIKAITHRQGGTHERNQPLRGSVDSNDAARFHDEAFQDRKVARCSRFLNEGRTVKSLYGGVNPCQEHEQVGLSPSEQQFLALALKAWRATNSAGRKALRSHLTALANGA